MPAPSGKRGRQQQFSDAAIQTCLTLKALSGYRGGRRRASWKACCVWLDWVGLGWAAHDFSTLRRRQKTLNVSLPYRGGVGPPNRLVDSAGIKAEGAGEWSVRKHRDPKRRIGCEIHIDIDVETVEAPAVEVATSDVGDAATRYTGRRINPSGEILAAVKRFCQKTDKTLCAEL